MAMTLNDTRGKQSKTLFFVTVSWSVLLVKFLVAGMKLGSLGTMLPMTATEFGAGAAAILAIWVGREWKDKDIHRGK